MLLWQPLVCNLCNEQGHKSVDCPNRDKCRRCGQSGHFARSCPTPWGPVACVESAVSTDFPALGDSLVCGVASGSTVTSSPEGVEPPTAGAFSVDRVVEQACDSFLSAYDLFGDIASISDDSEGSICNNSLEDLMFSETEDSNAECSVGVKINAETVVDNVSIINETVNDTVVTVNVASDHAEPASALGTAAHVNSELSNAAISDSVNENNNSNDQEVTVNVNNEVIRWTVPSTGILVLEIRKLLLITTMK